MSATLADLTKTEEASIATFDQLVKAKTEEIDAMKDDLSDVEESLIEDKKFLAELQKSCATKEAEWAEICKLRSEELLALADTIKILNDDDALELFEKTLPGA